MTPIAPTDPWSVSDARRAPLRSSIFTMTQIASNELWSVFDARRVKAPELRGLDASANAVAGWFKNHTPFLAKLKAQAERIEAMEKEVKDLGATRFQEAVREVRDLARLN